MASPPPEPPLTRRALAVARAREDAAARRRGRATGPIARHARRGRSSRGLIGATTALAMALLLGSTAGVTSALVREAPVPAADATPTPTVDEIRAVVAAPDEPAVSVTPPPIASTTPPVAEEVAGIELCDDPQVAAALAAGDDGAVIAAAQGAEPLRAAVAAGVAPCIHLDDPARTWVVVNKVRPFAPIDYAPAPLVAPEGVRALNDATLRADAAAALSAMVAAARAAGAGELAIESAYRSFQTQHSSYGAQVSMRGTEQADLVSARPGHSEHQSGLTVDLVPCDGGCRTIDDLAASPQGAWVVAHAWEFGWITRYVDGATGVTGYLPEPWHLRYVGPDLARAYHEGGWTSLEEFFGLPAAPAYAG